MIPKKSELKSTQETPDQAIRKFVALKAQLNEFNQQLESAELEAISEALTIQQYNQEHNKNNIVYQDNIAKVVLCFRQKYASVKDSVELARLEEDIRAEEVSLMKRNALKLRKLDEQISELENQIRELEERKEKLTESKAMAALQARYQRIIADSAYKVPNLVVHFKK